MDLEKIQQADTMMINLQKTERAGKQVFGQVDMMIVHINDIISAMKMGDFLSQIYLSCRHIISNRDNIYQNHLQQMPRLSSSSSSSSQSDSSSSEPNQQFVSVIVEKLSRNVTEDHIRQIFSYFGTVGSVFMYKGLQLHSYALVRFRNKHEAQIAISYMNKGYIDGSQISVQMQPQKHKSQSPKRKDKKHSKKHISRERRKHKKHSRKYRYRRSRSSSSSGVSSSPGSDSGSSS